jgi:hypothetical protein
MGHYRKKPVVVEAHRWDGLTITADIIHDWSAGAVKKATTDMLFVDTLEGRMLADLGDWIIKGVKGEFYPCKPDIFAATYEATDPPPSSV